MRWTPKEAAAAWQCSRATAYRLLKKHPEARESGAARPDARRGNPNFATSDYQRAQANKRWEGHVSKTQARAIVRGFAEIEFQRTVAHVSQYITPATPEAVEDWEPYPLPEEQEGYEPTEPFYTEQSLRDKAARKAARQPKGSRTE